MAKIKIISNPYKKEVQFKRWSASLSEWENIDIHTTPNSKLLSKANVSGFFPFRAKQIVELIIEEYGVADEPLIIEFEGSDDEYQELVQVCGLCNSELEIIPKRSEIGLENARDILPEVKNLFQEMSPLIYQSVTNPEIIERDLHRFSEAARDEVPICVLGNYSAGKSTFISALIGVEILPSGSEPITSKIYKITRSKYPDRAQIKCKYCNHDITVLITDRDSKVIEEIVGNPLASELNNALADMENEEISVRMNKALTVINDYEGTFKGTQVSDLIEVEIPFVKGVLAKSQHPFVIFDTPGSNSASNAKHLQVLKSAMANMTNGLPIFICTAESLDSTDNENLYHIIDDLDELDNRFTMIVVNKADNAGVQRRGTTEQDQKRILRQAVPRNLYSGGLFYVSSILGLGSKTDGEFVDEVYADIYDAQRPRYENPSNKFYRSLYLYDIMPEQIKQRADELASKQEELVYANSGLFTVEKEIETFAGKYAAYNKCFQSQMFLNKVIQTTEGIIESDKRESEDIRQRIKDDLEEDKKELIEILEDEASAKRNNYDLSYPGYMGKYLGEAEGYFTEEDLREQEKLFTEAQEDQQDYDEREQDELKAWGHIGGNLKSNIGNLLKKRDASSLKNVVQDLSNDFGAAMDKTKARVETRREVDKATSDELLRYITEMYDRRLEEIYEMLDEKSKDFWATNTEELRKLLAIIVTGSDVLTDEKKTALERVIIEYEQLSFDERKAEDVFRRWYFEKTIKIGKQKILLSDHLDIKKLVEAYNNNIKQNAENCYFAISKSHTESAHTWIQNLLNDIFENIVDYNPELSKQARQIQKMTKQIEMYKERQQRLREYTEQLGAMMDWKAV